MLRWAARETVINQLSPAERLLFNEYVEHALSDLRFFAEEFLGHMLTFKMPVFHVELYGMLQENKRLVIAAPRGFAKSTISSVIYPIWLAVRCMDVKDIVIISASETLAVELLRKIKREFEQNDKIRRYFGELMTDKWSETHIIVKGGVNIRARGAGAQIRGFRPDCLLLDDIESDEGVESEEQRKKLKEWLFKSCLNTLLPHGQLVIVGTILNQLSLLNELLNSDNNWKKKRYRAYLDSVQAAGHELWADLWPHDKLQVRKKEIGTWAFASEYMNDPMSDENAAIKESQLRYWTQMPDCSIVIAMDPAYKDDDSADWKVSVVVGIDQQMNRYLLSYIRTHAPIGEYIDATLNIWMQYKDRITGFGCPSAGVESQFFKTLMETAERRKIYPPFAELKNSYTSATGITKRNNHARIRAALGPLFEAGKYFINASHSEAKDELLMLGPSMRWDDIVDAMTYAEQILVPAHYDTQKDEKQWRNESLRLTTAPNYGVD